MERNSRTLDEGHFLHFLTRVQVLLIQINKSSRPAFNTQHTHTSSSQLANSVVLLQVHVQLPTNVTAQRGDAYSSGVICKHDILICRMILNPLNDFSNVAVSCSVATKL